VIQDSRVDAPQFSGSADAYPFFLHPFLSNLHDGSGANLPWLQELPDPLTSVVYGSWVELNPTTAQQLGVSDGDVVDVESMHGRISAPVCVFQAIRPDVVAMPIGQGHSEYGRYAQHRGVNPLQILAPQVEPSTGALAWSATRVKVVRTGRRVQLLKTDGTARELGRGIVRTTAATTTPTAADHSAALRNIPIKVVSA
jgi:molybdopterin-containing oxidoreductase family iron-sulfur binding subunit